MRYLIKSILIYSVTVIMSSSVSAQAPTVMNCADLILECDGDYSEAINFWMNRISATSVCDGNVTITNNYNMGSLPSVVCNATGQGLTVTFTARDECGNSSTCRAQIRIVDSIDPVLTCVDDLILECDGDYTTEINQWLVSGFDTDAIDDACDRNVSITHNYNFVLGLLPPVVCSVNGQGLTVLFTATDDCGNSSTCSRQIKIVDRIDPVINCVGDLILECDGDYVAEINQWLSSVRATDMCDGNVTITNNYNFGSFPDVVCGTIDQGVTVLFTATDDCGNSSTCSSQIRIIDGVAPVISCVNDLVLECDGDYSAEIDQWLNSVRATDVCHSNVTILNNYNPGSLPVITCNPIGQGLTVVFTARDECGNYSTCTAQIRIIDRIPPLINCVSDLILECDGDHSAGINQWLGSVTATDFCEGNVTVTNNYNGNFQCNFNDPAIAVTFTATDDCGNSSDCTLRIRTVGSVAPVINCVNDLILECDRDYSAEINFWLNGISATSVCDGNVTITNNYNIGSLPFEVCPSQGLTVIFTARDECGNSSTCTAEIRIVDSVDPVMICPDDLTLFCDGDYDNQIIPWLFSIPAIDACGANVSITNDYNLDLGLLPPVVCSVNGQGLTVVFTATDDCGNSSTCSRQIRIVDYISPMIFCNDNLILECDGDYSAEINQWLGSVTATNECEGNVTITNNYNGNFQCNFNDPAITVTFTATDDCGNSSTCMRQIRVKAPDIPEISVSDATVTEGNVAQVQVCLSNPATTTQNVTVDIATVPGSATTADYTSISNQRVTITAGQTCATVSISTTDDALEEGVETFIVLLSNASGGTLTDALGIVTINDNDGASGTPEIAVSDATVTEGNVAQVQVCLSNPATTTQNVTVDITTIPGSATAADYTSINNQRVTIAAGQTCATVSISTTDDALEEGTETFIVQISNASGGTLTDALGIVTINDNDGASGTPEIAVSDATVTEGNVAQVQVCLSNPATTTQNVTVDITTIPGSATTADYTSISNQRVTITAGQTCATVSISTTDDALEEGTETFIVQISNASGGTLTDALGIVTINDNDTSSGTPEIAVSDATVTEGNVAQVQVCLSNPATSTQNVTVDIATVPGSATTADYTSISNQRVTIAAGQTCATVSISTTDDALEEGTEAFIVQISNAVGGTLTDALGIVTINDNEGASGTPEIAVSDATVTEGNVAQVQVCLSNPATTTQNVTVDITTIPGSATTADYTSINNQRVTIAAGQTCATVSISTTDDALEEGTETFIVQISNAVGGTLTDALGIVTINDNEGASGTPEIAVSDATVTEGNVAQVQVCLSNPATTTQNVTVDITTIPGSATTADYTSISNQRVTITAGQTCATVNISTTDDALEEGMETFIVQISNAVGGTVTDAQGVVTINDNEGASGTPEIAVSDATVTEGNVAQVQVCLSNPATTTQNVTVDIATIPGSATTADYTSISNQRVTITAGQTCATVSISTTDDALEEGTETFIVQISNAVGGTLTDAQGVVTINDNDGASGTPEIAVSDATVTEGNVAQVQVCLSNPATTTQNVTVDITTIPGSATTADYTSISNQRVTITAGQTCATVNISTTDDALEEGTETFIVQISNAIGGTLTDAQGVVTINDNDGASSCITKAPIVILSN